MNYRLTELKVLLFLLLLPAVDERGGECTDVNGCYLRVVLETRDFAQIKEIRDALVDAGFKLV